ncbi:hypothetical protein GLP52_03675 [Sulfitobacter sp. M22]|nr:hypothetical protein [Sulfitobacter sp. M22]MCF7725781.1 hypothetical protein [Sulfitobacter sp. M22]
MRGIVDRDERAHELSRNRNYELANLIAFAFHDPKKMPKLNAGSRQKDVPDEVAQLQVRAFFMAMAKKPKG